MPRTYCGRGAGGRLRPLGKLPAFDAARFVIRAFCLPGKKCKQNNDGDGDAQQPQENTTAHNMLLLERTGNEPAVAPGPIPKLSAFHGSEARSKGAKEKSGGRP